MKNFNPTSLFPVSMIGAISIALSVAVGGCGDESVPQRPELEQEKIIDPQQPTPEQEKALANPLHIEHLEDEEEPSKCRDCHAIKGHERTDPGHRCLKCHEDQKSAVHQSVANEDARECMTCHEFMEPEVDPWSCAGCHTEGVESAPVPKIDLPEAPIVDVHAEEACNTCHLPHGDEGAVELGECLECHEEQTSDHNAQKLDDPAQCAECHESHDPAEAAKALCADCHVEDVPVRAALFEGHDQCTSCHAPHEPNGVVACRSCHEDTKTVGMRTTPEHRDCASCHDPHRVTRSPERSCVGCHDQLSVDHPPDEDHGTCVGCHPSHPFRGRLVYAKNCVVCHDEAPTETSFHSGESCGDCHQPHTFGLASAGNELCSNCHIEGALTEAAPTEHPLLVSPIADHSQCDECHVDAAHEPSKATEACGTCHEPVQQTLTAGHEQCAECHLPHEGTVETTCKDCHEEKWTSRHVTDGQDCAQCHRAHGPEGPEEPKACVTCHDQKLPLLHQHEEHQDCGDCHDFHDRGPQRSRSTCLSACHSDMVDHEPAAVSCVGCHPFETEVPNWLQAEEEAK